MPASIKSDSYERQLVEAFGFYLLQCIYTDACQDNRWSGARHPISSATSGASQTSTIIE
jgi:hypothetical protein